MDTLHTVFMVWLGTAPIFVMALWGHLDPDSGYSSDGWVLFAAPLSFLIAGAINAALSVPISVLPFSDALHTESSRVGCCDGATTGESFATFYLGHQNQHGLPSSMVSTPYASIWLGLLGAQCGVHVPLCFGLFDRYREQDQRPDQELR